MIFCPDNIQVKIFLNGELIYQFGEPGSFPPFARIPGMEIAFYHSKGITMEDNIEFYLKSDTETFRANRFDKMLNAIRVASVNTFYEDILYTYAALVMIGISIVLVGVLVVIGSVVLWKKDNKGLKKGLEFSFFAFVGGFYIMTDAIYPFLPLFVRNPVLCNFLDVGTVFLIVPSFCLYFYVNMESVCGKLIMQIVTIVQALVSSIVFSLQLMGTRDLFQLQFFAFIPGILGTIIGVFVVSFEGIRKKNRAAKYVVLSFFSICVGKIQKRQRMLYSNFYSFCTEIWMD